MKKLTSVEIGELIDVVQYLIDKTKDATEFEADFKGVTTILKSSIDEFEKQLNLLERIKQVMVNEYE